MHLQGRIQQIQANLTQIRTITSKFVRCPLFERKDSKADAVLCMDERDDRISKRYSAFQEISTTIHE